MVVQYFILRGLVLYDYMQLYISLLDAIVYFHSIPFHSIPLQVLQSVWSLTREKVVRRIPRLWATLCCFSTAVAHVPLVIQILTLSCTTLNLHISS